VTFWSLPPTAASARASVPGNVRALAASPDARWLATGTDDGMTRVWSTPALKEVTAWPHPAAVTSLAFSGNGQWLAVAGRETLRLLSTRDWKPVADRQFPKGIEGLVFSPDHRWLAAVGWDAVHLVSTAPPQRILPLPHQSKADTVAFSPDGRFVATRTPRQNQRAVLVRPTMTRVFDLATGGEVAWKSHEKELDAPTFRRPAGQEPKAFEGGRTDVLAEAARWPWIKLKASELRSDDGRWWIRGGGDLSDQERRTRQSLGSLDAFAFVGGGRWLATAKDGTVSLWPLRFDDLRDETCRRVTRNLKREEEWRRYVGSTYERTCAALPTPD
jgi:WD40 repeat protein